MPGTPTPEIQKVTDNDTNKNTKKCINYTNVNLEINIEDFPCLQGTRDATFNNVKHGQLRRNLYQHSKSHSIVSFWFL